MCVFVFNGILIVRKSQIVLFESLQVHQKQTCKRKSVFYAVTWMATSSFSVPPHCVSNVLKSSNDTLNSISNV